jgi:hypothetical protein
MPVNHLKIHGRPKGGKLQVKGLGRLPGRGGGSLGGASRGGQHQGRQKTHKAHRRVFHNICLLLSVSSSKVGFVKNLSI